MYTILYVEDNLANARLVMKILNHHGYDVVHVERGIEALQVIHTQHPDLILLDIDLPDMDGKTLANRFRRTPWLADTPIIALTAHNTAQMKRLALAYGCDAFLTKPIDTARFAEQVGDFLAKKAG